MQCNIYKPGEKGKKYKYVLYALITLPNLQRKQKFQIFKIHTLRKISLMKYKEFAKDFIIILETSQDSSPPFSFELH